MKHCRYFGIYDDCSSYIVGPYDRVQEYANASVLCIEDSSYRRAVKDLKKTGKPVYSIRKDFRMVKL